MEYFKNNFEDVDILEINERHYYCVKKMEKGEVFYIFFSPELYMDQLEGVKERRIWKREESRGNKDTLGEGKGRGYPCDKGDG